MHSSDVCGRGELGTELKLELVEGKKWWKEQILLWEHNYYMENDLGQKLCMSVGYSNRILRNPLHFVQVQSCIGEGVWQKNTKLFSFAHVKWMQHLNRRELLENNIIIHYINYLSTVHARVDRKALLPGLHLIHMYIITLNGLHSLLALSCFLEVW